MPRRLSAPEGLAGPTLAAILQRAPNFSLTVQDVARIIPARPTLGLGWGLGQHFITAVLAGCSMTHEGIR